MPYERYINRNLLKQRIMSKKIKSLNNELPDFFLESLELRLETDPLTIGGLLNLAEQSPDNWCISVLHCDGDNGCREKYQCSIHI